MVTDKEALIYTQNCEQFRSLNGFFWQVPLIMMTLNGGLWYSVASLDLSEGAQRGVLGFAVIANIVMMFGLSRLRSVMQDLLVDIHHFQGTHPPGKARRIQYAFQGLLLAAAAGALWVSCDPSAYFIRKANEAASANTASATPGPVSVLHLAKPPPSPANALPVSKPDP
jgi:hypothetical protein